MPMSSPAPRLRIALVAHDHKKDDLLDWAKRNLPWLQRHSLVATGTTGALLERELAIPVRAVLSGPLGGDLQIGAEIAQGEIDVLFFFWDPLQAQPHDPDVKALLRAAVLWNIPFACNEASSDGLLRSPCLNNEYQRKMPDHTDYRNRYSGNGATN